METSEPALVIGAQSRESFWFLGTLATIRIDAASTVGRYAMFEVLLPKAAAPPLHTHPQDETFIVVDGRMCVWIGDTVQRCEAGSIIGAPGGTPHTFFVESETARVLTLSVPAGIERLVTLLGTPALTLTLPPDDDKYPSRPEIDAAFAACDMKILGPAPTEAPAIL
jgi:quercetin dioxygenase-like cupin family protein